MHQPPASLPVQADQPTLGRSTLIAGATELCAALRQVEAADRSRQLALERSFAGFAAQVRDHLELVDTFVVPALAARGALDLPALDTIAADHAWTDQVLSDLGDALGVLSFGLGAERWWLGQAADLAGTLEHVLASRLSREDQLLSDLVSRWFSTAERDEVGGALAGRA